MKYLILIAIVAFTVFSNSCGTISSNSVERINGILLIGNKPYKMVDLEVDGHYARCIVPADSSVSIIPASTTYTSGKTQTSTIVVQ